MAVGLPILVAAGTGVLTLGILGRRFYFSGGVCKTPSSVRLDGKVAVVTGANTGIGYETARQLVQRGAKVIIAGRDEKRCKDAVVKLIKETGSSSKQLEFRLLDLGSLASVRSFASSLLASEPKLHLLINNAGIMSPSTRTESADGFEVQFGVNHLGHFLLTHLLTDRLKSSGPGSRVVIVSSSAHTSGHLDFDDLQWINRKYSRLSSYGDSKLANVLHARELAKREPSLIVTSLHPGVIATELARHFPLVMRMLMSFLRWFIIKTPWEGSQTTLHCAIDPSVVQYSGLYFSDCVVKPASPDGQDDAIAARLWSVSEKLVGIKP